jgi:hypothetical protein
MKIEKGTDFYHVHEGRYHFVHEGRYHLQFNLVPSVENLGEVCWVWTTHYNKKLTSTSGDDEYVSLSNAKRAFRAAQKAMAKFKV